MRGCQGSRAATACAALMGEGKTTRMRLRAGMQMGLRGNAPDAEAVVCGEDLHTIEIDFRCCIKALEDEVNVGTCKKSGSDVEVEAVLPARVLDPLQFGFVIAKEWVGDFLVGKEIEVHIAGNCGGEPTGFWFLRVVSHLTELPPVIEREDGIFEWSLACACVALVSRLPYSRNRCQGKDG